MASPQKENGYTQISNEILEAFARTPSLGSEAFQVLMLALRYTYGFQRKKAEMAITFIQRGTGMKHANVIRAIKRLVSKRILVRVKSSIEFNKNYEEWLVSKRIPSIQTDTPPVSKRIRKAVSKRIPKKENINKTILKKESEITPYQTAISFFEDQNVRQQVISYLIEKGVSEKNAVNEINKFISYWTEPNRSGTKQRWQMEKTFEVKRRLTTWLGRMNNFSQENKRNKTIEELTI